MNKNVLVQVYHIVHNELTGKPEGILHVANVDYFREETDMEPLDYAYRWTQNMYDSWSIKEDGNRDNNRDVYVKAPLHVYNGKTYGLRSSMIGDIFCMDGKFFVCVSIGFREISREDLRKMKELGE